MNALRERLSASYGMIVGSDIDGLISAMMLASVADWRIVALVTRSGSVLVAPNQPPLCDLIQSSKVFGVDLFSPIFPTISNHPVLFGRPQRPPWLQTAMQQFDDLVRRRTSELGSINPSIWAGIGATFDRTKSPQGFSYKYPLGTAQVLVAARELVGRPPRFYDRQFLPWLIADCDGGLESIRKYHWNVELWWSALAAVAGPASRSEALYQLAATQRPTQTVDVDLRLRSEHGDLADALNPDWNLADNTIETFAAAANLLRELSGWPDPFASGVESLGSWVVTDPTRNIVKIEGLRALSPEIVETHLRCASEALHVNFSRFFERGTALGWMVCDTRRDVEALLGGPPALDLISEPKPDAATEYA